MSCLWCSIHVCCHNESNNSDPFEHPPFAGKINNCCIPNIWTPMFEIIIPISENRHLANINSKARGSIDIRYSLMAWCRNKILVYQHYPSPLTEGIFMLMWCHTFNMLKYKNHCHVYKLQCFRLRICRRQLLVVVWYHLVHMFTMWDIYSCLVSYLWSHLLIHVSYKSLHFS